MENNTKNKSNKCVIIAFIIILILQILAIVYATNKRQWFHMDELYSYGLIHYKNPFIFWNDDFENVWHSPEYFKEYLTISEEEKWDFSAVYKNQVQDVHPPLYYLLLRIVCTFNIGKFSIWPGTILNIILFVFSSITLYLIGKKVFENKYYSILLILLNGFSIASIETVMYNRMYQLLILHILISIYWHLSKNNTEVLTLKNDLIYLYIIVILGFLTHYYYTILIAILYIMYVIKYIIAKNYKNIIKYTITLICSFLTSIIIFPYSLNHIFFSYRGKEAILNVSNIFPREIISKIIEYIKIINLEICNGCMFIIIGLIIILTILLIINYKKLSKHKNENIKYIIIPAITYLIIVILISPYKDLRYIMPIVPLLYCWMLYVFYYILKNILSEKITFKIILILIILFSILTIPKLSDNALTYKIYDEIDDITNGKTVIVIYKDLDEQYNKIMTIYNIFMNSKQTYILPEKQANADKIIQILKDKDISDGVILITPSKYEEYIKEINKTELFNHYQGLCKITTLYTFLLK